METPEHKHEIAIRIGAHDWEGLLRALHAIQIDIARHTHDHDLRIVSGGPDYGYSVYARTKEGQTAESYFAEVEAWIEETKRRQD